jgi:hypothetical protein
MNGDFGTELDAALNAHLSALRAAAAEAKSRVERGVETLSAAVPQRNSGLPPLDEPSPMVFDGPPFDDVGFDEPLAEDTHHRSGAPVSFDLDEEPSAVDAEGIPFPEENF